MPGESFTGSSEYSSGSEGLRRRGLRLPACWLARFATVLAKRPRNVGRYIGAALRPRGDRSA